MWRNLAVQGIAALALLAGVESSGAEVVYPWCAQYGTKGGARNCGFVSWQQCRAAVSGVGGYCSENPFYWAPPGRVPATEWKVASVAPRTYPVTDFCHLKGRRGDPQLYLRQQASGCF